LPTASNGDQGIRAPSNRRVAPRSLGRAIENFLICTDGDRVTQTSRLGRPAMCLRNGICGGERSCHRRKLRAARAPGP
jgi:hypothetical protein